MKKSEQRWMHIESGSIVEWWQGTSCANSAQYRPVTITWDEPEFEEVKVEKWFCPTCETYYAGPNVECCDRQLIKLTGIDQREVKEPEPNPIKEALETLSNAMKEDEGYAWGWQCNLAMMAKDAGVTHQQANIRAADLMKRLFGIDFHPRLKEEFGYPKPEPEVWEGHIRVGALGNYVDLPSSASEHGGKRVEVRMKP